MKSNRIWFGLTMVIAILACVGGMMPFLTSLSVVTPLQKSELLYGLEVPLESTAISQARIVDPAYQFISMEGDYSETERSAIWENALRSLSEGNVYQNATELRTDSNLAWKISYNGKTYEHNWPETLADNPILNVKLSRSEDMSEIQIYEMNGYEKSRIGLWTPLLINAPASVMVNTARAESSNSQTPVEVAFEYQLPPGFEIQYYIGPTLKANGGLIATLASNLHGPGWSVPIILALLALIVLFMPKNLQFPNFFVEKMMQIKLGIVVVIYAVLGNWLYGECVSMSHGLASGSLALSLQGLGLWKPVCTAVSGLIYVAFWSAFYGAASLLFLYIKAAFVFGLSRFFKEDTLFGMFMRQIERYTLYNPGFLSKKKLWMIIWLAIAGYVLLCLVCCVPVFLNYGPLYAVAVMMVFVILSILMVRTIMRRIQKQYDGLLKTTEAIENGEMSEIPVNEKGMFSMLYVNLAKVQERYSKALQEGLSSQNMKTQLISNISHDLKTPITGIQSYSDLIRESDDLEQIHQYAGKLQNYASRMSSMIQDLFDVAKADSGQIIMNPMEISLQALCEQVAAEWQTNFETKGLKLNMSFATPGMVMLDPDKMVRVIDNLMSNILKYAQPDTRVYITETQNHGRVELSFRNVSKDELDFDPDMITERFVRGQKSRSEPGSGLGLSIVKSFVALQQGTCQVIVDRDIFIIQLSFPALEKEKAPEEEEAKQGDKTEEPIQTA